MTAVEDIYVGAGPHFAGQPISECPQYFNLFSFAINQQLDILRFDTKRTQSIVVKDTRIIIRKISFREIFIISDSNNNGNSVTFRLSFY